MAHALKFLQISDVHLDSPMAGGRLQLPADKAEQRRTELRQVFAGAFELARERAVEVVLLPGDLFDDEAVSDDTVNFVIDVMARSSLPVIITPGNHDPYSRTSPYSPSQRQRRGQPAWPDSVFIVQQQHFTAFHHPLLPDVSFTSMAYDRNRRIDERLLAQRLPRNEAPLQLLLFHGSRRHYAPPGKMETLPFSDQELTQQGFHYAAIGHYHSYASIESEGQVVGAYSGYPAGRSVAELGQKIVLLGGITRDDKRPRVALEPVQLDRRQVGRVEISVQGATHRQAFLERLEHGLNVSGHSRDDLLLVEVTGRLPRGIDATIPEDFLTDRFFHLAFDTSGVKPDYDLEVYLRSGHHSTESRFVQEMRARIGNEPDPERRAILENALYYGLDALIQKEVVPRYED